MRPLEAVEYYGSQAAMARRLDVSDSAVGQWVRQGFIPFDRQCQIQIDSAGAVLANKEDAKPVAAAEGRAA